MTKEQVVQKLMDGYIDDFYKATGMRMACSLVLPKRTVEQVLILTANYYGCNSFEIIDKVRYKNVVRIRQMIAGICKEIEIPDENIALILDCERSTVTKGRDRFEYKLKNNEEYRKEYLDLKEFVFR